MVNANGTTGINFILLGLFNHTQIHLFLFAMVLMIFITSLMGNTLMIILIHVDPQLHMPMYFLLSQLSFMDMPLVSTIVPKMAANYLMDTRSISPTGCGVQIFLLLTLGGSEFFLLTGMSYDRYVAICHPLRYPILMSQKLCLLMTSGSWLLGGIDGLMQCSACGQLEPGKKAFKTCSSHLVVVGLFYGTIMFIYMRPKSNGSEDHDKVVSAFYTIFTPVLNPLIFSVIKKSRGP
ncbi:olfactory receptor 2M4-like [Elephas maximus indicus]|uniref:olfactory receptor 2M4-like n=1 Tax=Elephas maximus indicus TaxID=99487 RepID=UPI0021172B60|nr:olfactory receptor 2M4-like [Elephas maximus indicus]